MELLYVMLFFCYASYAYNRKSVAFSMPMLKEDGLDTSYAGLVLSCQNIAFSISKFVAGVLSDRLNPQLLFATGLLVSGFATLAFSSSDSVTIFCALWFLNGLAQGCGWPSCAKILRERASPSQFGTLWSLLSSSNNFSGSLGPILSALITVNFGWRWGMFFAGFLSVSLGIVFLCSLPFLTGTSKSKLPKSTNAGDKNDTSTMTDLLGDPFIWLLSVSFMVIFCARSTTVDWGQLYLIEEKGHSQYVASAFMSSVETGGFIGRIAAGYLSDWKIKRALSSKQMSSSSKAMLRMSVAVLFVLGSVMSIHLFQFAVSNSSSSVWISCIGAVMGMCYYGPIAIFGIVSSESVPPHLSGSSHAIVALFGNIGATLAGLPFSYIAKYYGWSTVFIIVELLVAGIFLTLILCKNRKPKFLICDKDK